MICDLPTDYTIKAYDGTTLNFIDLTIKLSNKWNGSIKINYFLFKIVDKKKINLIFYTLLIIVQIKEALSETNVLSKTNVKEISTRKIFV